MNPAVGPLPPNLLHQGIPKSSGLMVGVTLPPPGAAVTGGCELAPMQGLVIPPNVATTAAPPPPSSCVVATPSVGVPTTMANSKEKTPMCLINELARYNKIQHQYHLIDESGLPHKKTFLVVLKLDKEEYTAAGPSIKKAQHAAAALGLQNTTFKHPPPKTQQQVHSNRPHDPITPTVELNALAMKRGEPAIYQLIQPQRPSYLAPNLNFRGIYNQRYHFPKIQTPFYVSLKVGNRQFFGKGRTAKEARHAAAEEALRVLRTLPLPDHVKKRPEVPKVNGENGQQENANDELKSPISLIYEMALKRSLPVKFEVTRESGPPHMRTFVTRCSVGEIITEGEGKGKQVSKKRAAEKMLEELKKLGPLPPSVQKSKKKPVIKKKTRNLIKEQKTDSHFSQGINPISRLIQIQHAKKDKEPIYSVIAERGESRQREFVIQCTLGDLTTTGTGPKKKTAKSNAAEAMLQVLGYSRPQPGKPALKTLGIENPSNSHLYQEMEKPRKVTFMENDASSSNGGDLSNKLEGSSDPASKMAAARQLVPGLIIMPDGSSITSAPPTMEQNNHYTTQTSVPNAVPVQPHPNLNRTHGGSLQKQEINKIILQTSSTIAKELLETGVSPTAEAIRKAGHVAHVPPTPLRPKQQLHYLAEVLGFQVKFTDFPKSKTNKLEHLCLVTLSTTPPQVKHGAGPTLEASHDQAALSALRTLAEISPADLSDSRGQNHTKDSIYISNVSVAQTVAPPNTAPKLSNDLGGAGGGGPPKELLQAPGPS